MKTKIQFQIPASIVLYCCFLFFIFQNSAVGAGVKEKNNPNILDSVYSARIPFIENKGQINHDSVKYYADIFGGTVFITDNSRIVYSFRKSGKESVMEGWAFAERFTGASKTNVQGKSLAVTKVNFLKGGEPSKFKKDISTYNSIDLGEIYKGVNINVEAHGNNVEKLFFIKPGAAIEKIRVHIDGANSIMVNKDGELEIITDPGPVTFTRPVAYQKENGRKKFVNANYIVDGGRYGFKVGAYDKTRELVIDPLIASTFLGGSGHDWNSNSHGGYHSDTMIFDALGNVYITGATESANFPTTVGAYDTTKIMADVFISKFDKNLEILIASTFLGGAQHDYNSRIAMDAEGFIYVTGETRSADFPITAGAYDATHNGGWYNDDIFIAKLNNDLDDLIASTFIGGGAGNCGAEGAWCMALDGNGHVYIAGLTSCPDYPTTVGAYSVVKNNNYWDGAGVISKFDGNLENLLASTFLLGSDGILSYGRNGSYIYSIAIDAAGDVYVTGANQSSAFPTTPGAYDTTHNGASAPNGWMRRDAFVSKLDSGLENLIASTHLGGAHCDMAFELFLSDSGDVYVCGETWSTDFPTTPGAYDETSNGASQAFISRLDSNLANLTASTLIGGSGSDRAYSLELNNDGEVYIAGQTQSEDFPTGPNAFDDTYNGGYMDAVISKFDHNLQNLLASTYLGGNLTDMAAPLLIDASGDVYVAGETESTDFPVTPGAHDETHGGEADTFITRLDRHLSSIPLNNPPTADAGENQAILNKDASSTTIEGSASDEDIDDVLEYRWLEGDAVLLDWSDVGANGECPLDMGAFIPEIGVHTLTLEVSDGEDVSSDEMTLTIIQDPDIIAVDGGKTIWKSGDGGVTWIEATPEFDDTAPKAMASDSNGNLYIVTSLSEIVKSGDAGETWTIVNSDYNGGEVKSDWLTMACSKFDDALYIIEKSGDDVWRSDDGGATWVKAHDNYNGGGNSTPKGAATDSGGAIFVVDRNADVWKSEDKGESWSKINDDYNGSRNNYAGQYVIGDDIHYIVMDAGGASYVYKSADDGVNFQDMGKVAQYGAAGASGFAAGDLYVSINYGNASPDIHRSENGATTWSHVGGVATPFNILALAGVDYSP